MYIYVFTMEGMSVVVKSTKVYTDKLIAKDDLLKGEVKKLFTNVWFKLEKRTKSEEDIISIIHQMAKNMKIVTSKNYIEKLLNCRKRQDYTPVFKSHLYTKQSGKYCLLLQVIESVLNEVGEVVV